MYRLFFVLSLSLSCFAHCQYAQQASQPDVATAFFTHPVRFEGETLSAIAHWYLYSPRDWKVLQELNPELDPLKLRIGDKIKVPVKLAKRQTLPPKQDIVGLRANNHSTGTVTGLAEADLSSQGDEAAPELATLAPLPHATESASSDDEKLFKDFKPAELEKQ